MVIYAYFLIICNEKNKNIMKIKLLFLTVLASFFLYSCEKKADKYSDCTDYDYEECDTVEPHFGDVNLNITVNDENSNVRVLVIEGNYESGDIIYDDSMSTLNKTYYLPVNKHYSAAAYYVRNNDTIIAVDGGFLEAYSYKRCDYTCYDVLSLNLDLRLSE